MPRKYRHHFPQEQEIEHEGRRAIGTVRAAQILNERAKAELGEDRHYSRHRIWELAARDKVIEAVTIGNTMLVYEDSVRAWPLPKNKYVPERKEYELHAPPSGYPQETVQQVLEMWESGQYRSQRQIAEIVKIPAQTVGRWIKNYQEYR